MGTNRYKLQRLIDKMSNRCIEHYKLTEKNKTEWNILKISKKKLILVLQYYVGTVETFLLQPCKPKIVEIIKFCFHFGIAVWL